MDVVRRSAAVLALAALIAAPVQADDAFALVDLDGRPVALTRAPGRPLVLHFWATWCPSCKAELGDLDVAASTCRGVDIVAVNVAEDASDVAAWLAERPLTMRVLIDPGGKAWRASGGREMPANAIWTDAGRTWSFGPSSASAWRERLAELGCAAAAARPGFLG